MGELLLVKAGAEALLEPALGLNGWVLGHPGCDRSCPLTLKGQSTNMVPSLAGRQQLASGEDPARAPVPGGLRAVVGGLQGLCHMQGELAQGLELGHRLVGRVERDPSCVPAAYAGLEPGPITAPWETPMTHTV